MCRKMLREGIPNGLLRNRAEVEDIENHLVERMDETNLIIRVRKERVPGDMNRGRPKNLEWDDENRYEEERPVHQWCLR